MADIVVITGLSGAGRSAAAAVLEDLGWYVVDNLPTSLVPTIVELAAKPGAGIDRLLAEVARWPARLEGLKLENPVTDHAPIQYASRTWNEWLASP